MKESKNENLRIIAIGLFQNLRFLNGWDDLHIKTNANINPIIQLYVAGYIEGVLTNNEINYHYNNMNFTFNQN